MGWLKKIFIFVLLFFILGEVIRLDFGNGLVIKPLDIGIGVLVLLWLVFKLLRKQEFKQRYVLIPVLLFFLGGFFSLIINPLHLPLNEFLISFSYLLRWIVYAGIFFIVSDFDKDFKKKIPGFLIILGTLIVGLGYVQYFLYSNLGNLVYLGWDEHVFRMFSVFLDPNFAGAFFVLFFLFSINRFLKKKSIPIGTLSAFTLIAVFLTFSRSALIMLIVGSSILFTLLNKKILIVLLLVITLTVLAISSKYFYIENINLFRVASSEARLETAGNAIKIIQNHPILGVGFNAYRYAQFQYGFRNETNAINHADASPDNSFLFVAATTGILGFVLYLFLWFRILKIASALVIASIAGVFVNSLFINSLFYPFIMLWFWILIAVKENN